MSNALAIRIPAHEVFIAQLDHWLRQGRPDAPVRPMGLFGRLIQRPVSKRGSSGATTPFLNPAY